MAGVRHVRSDMTVSKHLVKSLLELSAATVGKKYPCQYIDNASPKLDDTLLKKVTFLAFPENEKQVKSIANLTDRTDSWQEACDMVYANKVRDVCQVGFILTASIRKYAVKLDSLVQVSVTFERQTIMSSSCSQCHSDVWCTHVIAVVLYRIHYPHKVRVYAPMTEVLSCLNQQQLQKLIQYAVSEIPEAVMPALFKHVDSVRDRQSAVSQLSAAPDPSWGVSYETQWEQSIEQLSQAINSQFDQIPHDQNEPYAGAFSDSSIMLRYHLSSFVSKVTHLAQDGHMTRAAQVLTVITRNALHKLCSVSDRPELTQFAHELIHIFVILIVSPMSDETTKATLLDAAKDLNGLAELPSHLTEPNAWSRLPAISDTQDDLFWELFAALKLPAWPQTLIELMNGTVKSDKSSYVEDVAVMMLRLEVLFILETKRLCVWRVCCMVLHKLLPMVEKLSVLSVYLADTSLPSLLHAFTTDQIQLVKRRTGRRQSKSSDARKRPRMSLSQGELVYCWLSCMRMLLKLKEECSEDLPLLPAYCLLSLELAQHRWTEADLPAPEHDWLNQLQSSISEQLTNQQSAAPSLSMPVRLYRHALLHVGCQFYDGNVPLELVMMLLSVCGSDCGDELMQLSADVLINSGHVMQLGDDTSFYRRLQIQSKINYMANLLFSNSDVKKAQHIKRLEKVLHRLQKSSNVNMLNDMTRHLSLHLPKLTRDPHLLSAAFALVIHMHKTQPDKKHVSLALSIARKMGAGCLKMFIGRWRGVLSCEQLRELLIYFRPMTSEVASREMMQLIGQYFRAAEPHGERSIELLKILPDRKYEKARGLLLKQPEWFTASTLFELVEVEEKRRGHIDNATFNMLAIGLKRGKPGRAFVRWLVECCRRDGVMEHLFDVLAKEPSISVLLIVLENMKVKREKSSKKLGTALLAAYSQRFTTRQMPVLHDDCVREVQDLCTARDLCCRYVQNNSKRFDKNVVQSVRNKNSQNYTFMSVFRQHFS